MGETVAVTDTSLSSEVIDTILSKLDLPTSVGLDDIDISDNISLAHHAYWMRKLEVTQYNPEDYQDRDNGDTNYLECYASAYDYNEDGEWDKYENVG